MEELKHYKSTEKADHNGSDEKKLMKPNVNSMSSNGVQMRQIMDELMKISTPCQSHRMRGYHSKLHLKVIACGGTPEPHVKVIVCGGTTQISMPERLHGGGTPKTACQNHCMRGYLQNACQNDCMEGARPKIARQNHCMRGYHSRMYQKSSHEGLTLKMSLETTGGRVRKPTTSPV
ncbi:hypothetical protein M514_21123 [Trichuris suis]|uniref:Uncharacterized protein n=1 Tax=Trichuris suis TaxID=68888 RepID=A0A085NBC8_9BILA|nr:hypothetical protein M514_21123 [Trichuris suis]